MNVKPKDLQEYLIMEIVGIDRIISSLRPGEILESHENMGYLQGRKDAFKEVLNWFEKHQKL